MLENNLIGKALGEILSITAKKQQKKERQPFVVSPDIKVLVKLEVCENSESCVWSCSISR